MPPDIYAQERQPWCRVILVTSRGAELSSWELWGHGDPDLAALGNLAELQRAAQRIDAHLILTDICAALVALLDLSGLGEALSWEIYAAGRRPKSPGD